MRSVESDGSAMVFEGDRERCVELIADLHVFGLWATLRGRS